MRTLEALKTGSRSYMVFVADSKGLPTKIAFYVHWKSSEIGYDSDGVLVTKPCPTPGTTWTVVH